MYQYNNTDDIASAFGLTSPQLKSWARKNSNVAESFELAYLECNSNPYLKDTVRLLSTKSISEINTFFGFDASINKLTWTNVPIITLRSWFKHSPVTYVAFLLGQQKMILKRLFNTVGEDPFKKILNQIDVSEIIRMYCVSPTAYEKLLFILSNGSQD
jgi:hypothetical protein